MAFLQPNPHRPPQLAFLRSTAAGAVPGAVGAVGAAHLHGAVTDDGVGVQEHRLHWLAPQQSL